MDVGAVYVGFINDLSGDISEYNEGMIFGQCWNVYDGSC